MDGWERGRGRRSSIMAADERMLGAVSAMMYVYGYVLYMDVGATDKS